MRRVGKAAVLSVGAVLAVVVPALATTQPNMTYEPPKITLDDLPIHDSAEQTQVGRENGLLVLTSQPAGIFLTGDSEPGCESVPGGYACDRAGVERIVVTLGNQGDELVADLGASADKIRLSADGESGTDSLKGGPGWQILAGGGGADTLRGGAGDDLIKGGPGVDGCRGGPGDDTLVDCE